MMSINRSRFVIALFAFTMQFVALSCHGQTADKQPFFDIPSPELVTTTKKVEVVEVFNYGCIHCAHFQPLIDQWRKRLDSSKTEFVYLPAPFNPVFGLLARAYYAASSLGVAEKTHQEVFNEIHEQGMPVRTLDDVANIYAKLGVPRDQFLKAAQSFLVETQLRRANDLINKYRVDSTPTLIIAGKYRISTDSAGSQANMIKVADQLIAKELGHTDTSRQAPSKGK